VRRAASLRACADVFPPAGVAGGGGTGTTNPLKAAQRLAAAALLDKSGGRARGRHRPPSAALVVACCRRLSRGRRHDGSPSRAAHTRNVRTRGSQCSVARPILGPSLMAGLVCSWLMPHGSRLMAHGSCTHRPFEAWVREGRYGEVAARMGPRITWAGRAGRPIASATDASRRRCTGGQARSPARLLGSIALVSAALWQPSGRP